MVTKSVLLLILVLSSCLSDDTKESAFDGEWININMESTNSPLIYNFKSGNRVFTRYLNGQLSKRDFEILGNELLITSDTNRNFLEKYIITTQKEDSLILMHSLGYQLNLIPLKNIESKNIPSSDLRQALLEEHWLMHFQDSLKQEKRTVEFFRNNKYLFSYGTGESANSLVYSWEMSRIDSLNLIVFTDFKHNLFFIDSLSNDGIYGDLYASDGLKKSVFFERIEDNKHHDIEIMLAGGWELKSDNMADNVPVVIEFELEEDYRGYFMNDKSGNVLSIGSWNLSKKGNSILLDELKEGNRSVLNIINLDKKRLKIRYEGHDLEYAKSHLPI